MHAHRWPALIAVAVVSACTAPSGPATSLPPAASVPPSAAATASASVGPSTGGPVLAGSGYTLSLPNGWVDATDHLRRSQPQVDTGGTDSNDRKDDFVDRVTVVVTTSAEVSLDALTPQLEAQLEAAGSTDIEFKPGAQLDGRPSLQVWSIAKATREAHTIQFLAFNRGALFVLTITTDHRSARAADLAAQITGGWAWA